jgi:hypothetical protein
MSDLQYIYQNIKKNNKSSFGFIPIKYLPVEDSIHCETDISFYPPQTNKNRANILIGLIEKNIVSF